MANIEVAVEPHVSTTEKGRVLERLAMPVLRAQEFDVVNEIHVGDAEIDLLCRSQRDDTEIVVECKAYRGDGVINAPMLHKLMGIVATEDAASGWFFTTGGLQKSAESFVRKWESKPPETRRRFRMYRPEQVVAKLIETGGVFDCASLSVPHSIPLDHRGTWTLVLTNFGEFWCLPVLRGGVAVEALVFHAQTGQSVVDVDLIVRLGKTDTSLRDLRLRTVGGYEFASDAQSEDIVADVPFADSWDELRPARPEDFVGRKSQLDSVTAFIESVRLGESSTRVWAIVGPSGVGKSSLIVKLRSMFQEGSQQVFLEAVDVRAAKGPEYVSAALRRAFRRAAGAGFIRAQPDDFAQPAPGRLLAGLGARSALDELASSGKVLCLIFDQFEEVFENESLADTFEAFERIAMQTAGTGLPLCLGFAWKTDANPPIGARAYHAWHRLKDYRREIVLGGFDEGEVRQMMEQLEGAVGTKISPPLRAAIADGSQGKPWLLRKLLVHVFHQLKEGVAQDELCENSLRAEELFENDLDGLNQQEVLTLKYVAGAKLAAMDSVADAFTSEVMAGLIQKRLLVKSGHNVAVYWDIFGEYLATGQVQGAPFGHMPGTEPGTALKTALALSDEAKTAEEVALSLGFAQTSVMNIFRDLVAFGLATRRSGKLVSTVEISGDVEQSKASLLKAARKELERHDLPRRLHETSRGIVIRVDDVKSHIQALQPAAQHSERTWDVYAGRMVSWLSAVGLVQLLDDGNVLVRDSGAPNLKAVRQTRSPGLFTASGVPVRTVALLGQLSSEGPMTRDQLVGHGYRNEITDLRNLGLIVKVDGKYQVLDGLATPTNAEAVLADSIRSAPFVSAAEKVLRTSPSMKGEDVGRYVAGLLDLEWAPGTQKRNGAGVKRWWAWLREFDARGN